MGRKHPATVTHLEMKSPPVWLDDDDPLPEGMTVVRLERPPLHLYRYLYDTVGRNYIWVNRKRLSDEALASIIHHPKVEIHLAQFRGVPAGYAELDFRKKAIGELSFLGVVPEYLEERLGTPLLRYAIRRAWAAGIERMIVQTCTLDHPRALPLYQRHGFEPVGREEVVLEEVD